MQYLFTDNESAVHSIFSLKSIITFSLIKDSKPNDEDETLVKSQKGQFHRNLYKQ